MSTAVQIRRFILNRLEDESGISGVGIVAEGVEFSTGHCALTWLRHINCMAFYDNIKAVETVHGHAGKTKVEFIDA